MNELALFAGAGGGILGGKLLGWRTVCAVEWEPYPASVLCARQNDGLLPPFPIWDDVQTFDGKPWRGIVDVVSGGFPCQDISAAGKGAGIEGERSGMWRHMARVVGEVRPRFVFVENSPMLVTRGLERVLGDLTALGYDAKLTVMGAADVGGNHQRDRIWIVGFNSKISNTSIIGLEKQKSQQRLHIREREIYIPDSNGAQCQGMQQSERTKQEHSYASNSRWWQTEPNVGRVADGVAARVDRLKAIGNGQVPLCAAEAWQILTT